MFEIYAEGGGNTFSLEIDAAGRVFSGTNGGGTRGMYYPQGAMATKDWGKHGPLTNPYAFGWFEHMRHEGDGDRFPQTFVIYEGGALPAKFNRTVIAAQRPAQPRLGQRADRAMARPTARRTCRRSSRHPTTGSGRSMSKVGPDGAVYIADWYDTRLTHVDPRDNWHKGSGRIYRVSSREASHEQPVDIVAERSATLGSAFRSPVSFDLTKLSSDELIGLFSHPNKWMRQTAVRVLGERLYRKSNLETLERLWELVQDDASGVSLEALWTMHWARAAYEELLEKQLWHPARMSAGGSCACWGTTGESGRETAGHCCHWQSGKSMSRCGRSWRPRRGDSPRSTRCRFWQR